MSRNFVVTIKESAEGKPWLLVELHEGIGLKDNQHITFDLPESATYEDARKIANEMNSKLKSVRISNF